MKYKTVYMAHDVSTLETKVEKSGDVCEIAKWDAALNRYADDGWIVKKCGTWEAKKSVIFWALLEKREKPMEI